MAARTPRSVALVALGALRLSAGERVWIGQEASGKFQVRTEEGPLGSDGTLRGAGGRGHMDVAQQAGADAMRTWHVEVLNETLVEAAARGLRVSAGIWLPHAPSAYVNCSSADLANDDFWLSELDGWLAAVREHKDSPGLLWWTVGNEQELEVDVIRGSECVWKRLEWVVQAVKAADPNHPVGTVTAGATEAKVRFIQELAPSLDFLGVNAYGDGAVSLGGALRAWSWTKPYAIMEFGPRGHWDAGRTEWGAYIEETSSEKVPRYNATCYGCYDDPQCVGAFAFVWGWKWEKTGTWYNMFNEWADVTTGVAVNCANCESEVVEVLEKCWTGSHRVVRPPTLLGVYVDGEELSNMSFVARRSTEVQLRVDAQHPLGSALVGIWALTEEIVSDAVGGAFEATNPLLRGVWSGHGADATTASGLTVSMDTSQLRVGGEYRAYVFVRQDPTSCGDACEDQEAYASLPFRICHVAVEGEVCHRQVLYAIEVGIESQPDLYPGLSPDASFEEVQMLLYQQGRGSCPPPCSLRSWCHTALPGDLCHDHVLWLMERVHEHPGAYPEGLRSAPFEDVQNYLQASGDGVCPKACAARPGAVATTTRGGEGEKVQLNAGMTPAVEPVVLTIFAAVAIASACAA